MVGGGGKRMAPGAGVPRRRPRNAYAAGLRRAARLVRTGPVHFGMAGHESPPEQRPERGRQDLFDDFESSGSSVWVSSTTSSSSYDTQSYTAESDHDNSATTTTTTTTGSSSSSSDTGSGSGSGNGKERKKERYPSLLPSPSRLQSRRRRRNEHAWERQQHYRLWLRQCPLASSEPPEAAVASAAAAAARAARLGSSEKCDVEDSSSSSSSSAAVAAAGGDGGGAGGGAGGGGGGGGAYGPPFGLDAVKVFERPRDDRSPPSRKSQFVYAADPAQQESLNLLHVRKRQQVLEKQVRAPAVACPPADFPRGFDESAQEEDAAKALEDALRVGLPLSSVRTQPFLWFRPSRCSPTTWQGYVAVGSIDEVFNAPFDAPRRHGEPVTKITQEKEDDSSSSRRQKKKPAGGKASKSDESSSSSSSSSDDGAAAAAAAKPVKPVKKLSKKAPKKKAKKKRGLMTRLGLRRGASYYSPSTSSSSSDSPEEPVDVLADHKFDSVDDSWEYESTDSDLTSDEIEHYAEKADLAKGLLAATPEPVNLNMDEDEGRIRASLFPPRWSRSIMRKGHVWPPQRAMFMPVTISVKHPVIFRGWRLEVHPSPEFRAFAESGEWQYSCRNSRLVIDVVGKTLTKAARA